MQPAARSYPQLLILLLPLLVLAACAPREPRIPLPEPGEMGRWQPQETTTEERRFWGAIDDAEIIYIGEVHDQDEHHEFQLQVAKGMVQRDLPFAIGWEMFEWPQQEWIDQWEAGQITFEQLMDATQWRERWGAYSEYYETILKWTRDAGVRNIALNAPSSITRKIARGQPLDQSDQELLPQGFFLPPNGLDFFRQQMTGHPGVTEENLSRYYQAQLLWETTMAQQIIDFNETHPGERLLVLIGRGHVQEPYGVPYFVRQKSSPRQLVLNPGQPMEERPARIVRNRARLGPPLQWSLPSITSVREEAQRFAAHQNSADEGTEHGHAKR